MNHAEWLQWLILTIRAHMKLEYGNTVPRKVLHDARRYLLREVDELDRKLGRKRDENHEASTNRREGM